MITAEIEQAIKKLNPKIKKSLFATKAQDREDLEQEIKMKIAECFHNDVFEQAPGFWEFAERFD